MACFGEMNVLADHAYRQIKDAILRMELAPGMLVSERFLEEHLQVSRTPIRSALSRLATDGLVSVRKRGYLICPIDIKEYEYAYEYREACEVAVVKRAIERASRKALDRLDEVLGATEHIADSNQWFEESIDFHLELARSVDNPFLLRGVQDAMTRLERVRWFDMWTDTGRERATREHRDILRLIRLRRVDDAVAAMSMHIAQSREAIMAQLRKRMDNQSVFKKPVQSASLKLAGGGQGVLLRFDTKRTYE
jgi:DNA-binding GntR family transcriptional regulator